MAGTAAPGGVLVAVVGPSGAGKDSLIDYARRRLAAAPSILFVRRAVTRAADAVAEDHDSLTPAEFATAEADGAFAVCWNAHGLRYGVPSSALAHVRAGGVAVLNGSRAALTDLDATFGHMLTVHVTARPEILAARLAVRGRESAAEISQRLQRARLPMPGAGAILEIDNSGDLPTAGKRLVQAVQHALTGAHRSAD